MDVVALAGVISAGAVGFASVVASVLNGWFTRGHDRRMAREARVYEARSRVYEEALVWAQRRQVDLVQALDPDADIALRSPTPDEAGELRARIAAFGSPDVFAALRAYDEAFLEAWGAATRFRSGTTEERLPAGLEFASLNRDVQARLRVVEDMVRSELAQT